MGNKPIFNFNFSDGEGNISFDDKENQGAAWGKEKSSPFLSGSIKSKNIRFIAFLNKYNLEDVIEWLEKALVWAKSELKNSDQNEEW